MFVAVVASLHAQVQLCRLLPVRCSRQNARELPLEVRPPRLPPHAREVSVLPQTSHSCTHARQTWPQPATKQNARTAKAGGWTDTLRMPSRTSFALSQRSICCSRNVNITRMLRVKACVQTCSSWAQRSPWPKRAHAHAALYATSASPPAERARS